jgi:hypothetical protein
MSSLFRRRVIVIAGRLAATLVLDRSDEPGRTGDVGVTVSGVAERYVVCVPVRAA